MGAKRNVCIKGGIDMNRREDEDKAFGNAVYDAWRAGLNSDLVDRDRVTFDVRDGWYPDEAARREVGRLRRNERREQPQEQFQEYPEEEFQEEQFQEYPEEEFQEEPQTEE